MKKMNFIKIILAALILISFSCKKAAESIETAKTTFDLEAAKSAIESAGENFVIAFKINTLLYLFI